jgi:multimeric flavodoxin WrbA
LPENCGGRGKLVDKVATAFTSSQTEHGGQEPTTLAVNNSLCNPVRDDAASARTTRRSD